MKLVTLLIIVGFVVLLSTGFWYLGKHKRNHTEQRAEDVAVPANKAGVQQDVILDLRELLYCDQSLDQAFAFHSTSAKDEDLDRIVALIRQGNAKKALSELEDTKLRQRLNLDIAYCVAVAKAKLATGDRVGAQEIIIQMVNLPGQESRVKLQGWAILRELGYKPSSQDTNEVLGVIVETGFDDGVAIVAGYSDGEARMYYTSGGGLVGEIKDQKVIQAAKSLVKAAETVVTSMPLESARPLPGAGRIRFSIITPLGMHVIDEKHADVEEPSHRVHKVYVAMHDLLSNLLRIYKKE